MYIYIFFFTISQENFFSVFPHLAKYSLKIAGESFAGTYIPYIATAILNQNNKPDSQNINLSGILIGNGWMDPIRQYKAHIDYAVKFNIITKEEEVKK